MHQSLHAQGTMKALKMALEQKGNTALPQSLIHHSDRGIQYCCHDYIKILKKHEMLISMTNTPDPLENPLTERMHRTLKQECFSFQMHIKYLKIKFHEIYKILLSLKSHFLTTNSRSIHSLNESLCG